QPPPALHVEQNESRFRGVGCLLVLLIEQPPSPAAHRSIRQHAVGFLEALHGRMQGRVEQRVLAVARAHLQTLAKQRNLLMINAKLERRSIRDLDDVLVNATAGGNESLTQRLELGLVGLEAAQIRSGVGAESN